MNILDYIPVGQANAIPTKDLINLTGLSQRHVCAAIESARTHGEVILSKADGGYWLPDENDIKQTREELQRFVRFMDSRNTFKTTASARKMLRSLKTSNQGAESP
jgi:biotin operon repressor